MSYQAKIKRYILILQQLEGNRFPAISEMIDRINDTGIRVSERQLKRDFESLRDEFGLDICYSSQKHGYYFDGAPQSFPYFQKILEFYQKSELLTDYLKKGQDVSEIIHFENYNTFLGIDYLQGLAMAIHDRNEIELHYKKFDSDQEKSYIFQPYLLREYLSRWYVIGFLSGKEELRTFGLDRIKSFCLTGITFHREKQNVIAQLFQDVVGINSGHNDKAIEIQLSCEPYIGNLLKTLPLHPSQTVVSETTEKIILSIKVIVNFELKQRLLMIANQARVISPESLAEEIRTLISDAKDYYSGF